MLSSAHVTSAHVAVCPFPVVCLFDLGVIWLKHAIVTGAQHKRYKEFAETGQPLTWEAVAKIETQALIDAKMSADVAQATVAKAIQALKDVGVAAPVRIPWGN